MNVPLSSSEPNIPTFLLSVYQSFLKRFFEYGSSSASYDYVIGPDPGGGGIPIPYPGGGGIDCPGFKGAEGKPGGGGRGILPPTIT